MTEHFLVRCFLIGLSAASGLGPIFLLTLNQSSLYGFWKGFSTALGASVADAFYFFLAMLGILSIVESKGKSLLFMQGLSGILLIGFGIHLIRTKRNFETNQTSPNQSLFLSAVKSFLITIFNPFMLLFFIFISVHILPPENVIVTKRMLLLGGIAVGGGSLAILSLVAALGFFLGSKIKRSSLEVFSRLTGVIFGGIGIYLLVDFITKILSSQKL